MSRLWNFEVIDLFMEGNVVADKVLQDNNTKQTVASALSGYDNYFIYILDELKLLDLRLLRELKKVQKVADQQSFRANGFFIPIEEVFSLLNHPGSKHSEYADDADIELLGRKIRDTRIDIDDKLSATPHHELNFPLRRLAKLLNLLPFESDIMITALAAELDKKYGRIYAYFNDDLSKKLPSLSLALDLFCDSTQERLNSLPLFSPVAKLLYFQLIHDADEHDPGPSLNSRFRIDERIKRFLLGDNGVHASLSGMVELIYPDPSHAAKNIREETREKIIGAITCVKNQDPARAVFWLHGKAADEKKSAIESICNDLRIPLLVADLEDICLEPDQRAVLRNLFRDAALHSAAVFLANGDRLYGEDDKSTFLRRALIRVINEMSWVTFLSAESLWMPEDTMERCRWYPLEFALPGHAERKKIWMNTLRGSGIGEPDVEVLSGRFSFSESQIKSTVSHARQIQQSDEFTLESIYASCCIHSDERLSLYSTKVNPHFAWNDIVLPEDKVQQLREICHYISHKHIVYFKWGFEKKLALGRGLNILFSGPSGTGKTMASDIIAHELKLQMYKVDLSTVVSKYIGETEKNLKRIFRETSSGNIIIFFDEADALFGKRSEVKDAHDRYANIEINYLLQKMEEHEGIVILATNLSKNLDDAFLRRMHFAIEFPFPDEKQRELIWRKMFPMNAPLSEDIDYAFLSGRFRLAGGNIKNIALNAAFYAAEESSDITMRHIILAVKRELQKIGKLCVKGDFGKYYELLEDGGKA
jgi:SpoVK/Ycf46/Vps4 family AAA+-type ATPase